MTITSSGAISISDLEAEFGGSGSTTWRMSEYYKGGSYVPSTVVEGSGRTIPSTPGTSISLSDFYGAQNYVPPSTYTYTLSSNTQGPWDVRAAAISDGWDGSVQLFVVISNGVYVWSDSTSSAAMVISGSFPNGVSITNNGYIMGRGGDAGGNDGGPAVSNSSTGVSIINASGAYIAGGGGGGGGTFAGGGAGGGKGSASTTLGGAIGQEGDDGTRTGNWGNQTNTDNGGSAGGAGGVYIVSNSGLFDSVGGGGGGRILPGTRKASIRDSSDGGVLLSFGGEGGVAGGTGRSGAGAGNEGLMGAGGGGWGAAGGTAGGAYTGGTQGTVGGGDAGGAGGAAITGSSVNLTNNGTIFGTT